MKEAVVGFWIDQISAVFFWSFVAIMSVLQRMFGGKNKENIPTTEDAIQKLRQTEEMLEKKQEFLEKKIDMENATAKKHAKTNKRIAQIGRAHV